MALRAISTLLRMETPRAPGPTPSYLSAHVVVVLLTVGDAESIGRHALAQRAGLGEGAVRTVIKRLKSEGLIKTNAQGCELTSKGRDAYVEVKRMMPRIVQLPMTPMTVGRDQVALIVKRAAESVKGGIEQRDAAIRAGAAGATSYLIRRSKFQIPGSSVDCERDFPSETWSKLRAELHPENGDVVIICGSEDSHVSLVGAVSAALTLLG